MERTLQALLIGSLCVGAAACPGTVKNMRAVESVNTAVGPNEAIVIFLRPSGMGYAMQSSVFEVSDNRPATRVGIVAAKKKLAYRTTPGPHTFTGTKIASRYPNLSRKNAATRPSAAPLLRSTPACA